MYKIKEIYYTIQGEGFHAGRPAVFCRFSGCNLWSGREADRDKAICKFCDTDFWGTDGRFGGRYDAVLLAETIKSLWPPGSENIFVVCTGGEPALQMDDILISTFKKFHIEIAIETNGTLPLPEGIDWICVSPKSNTEIIMTKGDELKLVFPQKENIPKDYEHLDFKHFYLQPLDDTFRVQHTEAAIHYCLQHPFWKLSVQTHKYLGID
jgi:7-carboxy-7-deazaguanine synthase